MCSRGPIIEAHDLYKKWGSKLKCDALEEKFEFLTVKQMITEELEIKEGRFSIYFSPQK